MKIIKILKTANVFGLAGTVGPLYHGTTSNFENFEKNNTNENHTPTSDMGFIHLTGDRSYASKYGDKVLEFMVDLGRFEIVYMKRPEVLSKLKNGELDSVLVAKSRWRPQKLEGNEDVPPLNLIEEVVIYNPSRAKIIR